MVGAAVLQSADDDEEGEEVVQLDGDVAVPAAGADAA